MSVTGFLSTNNCNFYQPVQNEGGPFVLSKSASLLDVNHIEGNIEL